MKTLRNALAVTILAGLPATLPAQDPCDGLSLVSLTHAPFTDTALQVVLNYQGQSFMSYPQCSLLDANGEQVALEEINFFGIPPGENTHRMDLVPGAALPSSPLTGTLAVHYVTPDSLGVCIFDLVDVPLCPATECEDLQVFFFTGGGVVVESSFPWSVTDEDGEMVGAGTFVTEAAGQQQDFGSLCLAPGEYVLHVQDQEVVGLGLNFTAGVTQGQFITNGPQQGFGSGEGIDLPFSFYPGCASIGQAIAQPEISAPQITVFDRSVQIRSADGDRLPGLQILDISGRIIATSDPRSDRTTIDLRDQASGSFIIRSVDHEQKWKPQRFLLY